VVGTLAVIGETVMTHRARLDSRLRGNDESGCGTVGEAVRPITDGTFGGARSLSR